MTRFVYRCLLRAHPGKFREMFAAEMLWIYDQQRGFIATASLFGDACSSLARQWILRRKPQRVAVTASIAGGPSFQMFEDSWPNGHLIFQGAGFAAAAFAGLALIAGHGARLRPQGSSDPLQFEQTWVVRVLDANNDGRISAAEIADAPALLRTLDKDHDGELSAAECGAPAGFERQFMEYQPVLAALDRNRDGVISGAEIANAPAALRALDGDGSGDLTATEIRPAADAQLSVLFSEFRRITGGKSTR